MKNGDVQILGDMKVAQKIVQDMMGSPHKEGVTVNIVGQIQVNEKTSRKSRLPKKIDHVSPKLLADILDMLPEPRLDSLHALVLKATRNKYPSMKECMRYLGVNAQRYKSLSVYTHQRTKLLEGVSEEGEER